MEHCQLFKTSPICYQISPTFLGLKKSPTIPWFSGMVVTLPKRVVLQVTTTHGRSVISVSAHPDLLGGHTVVGVVLQLVDGERMTLPHLGRHQETHAGDHLQLSLVYPHLAQEAVEEVDGDGEHLWLAALLLAHLEQPIVQLELLELGVEEKTHTF